MENKITLKDTLYLFVISLLIIVFQTTFIPLLAVSQIVPDLLLILVVYVSLVKGQIPATVIGFLVGLIDDILSNNIIGLTAMLKVLIGFLSGYFFNENKKNYAVGELQFIILIFASTLLHNIFYIIFIIQGTEMTFIGAMFRSGIFSTVYTTIVALIPFFYFKQKIQT